jgi:hypothetical protein
MRIKPGVRLWANCGHRVMRQSSEDRKHPDQLIPRAVSVPSVRFELYFGVWSEGQTAVYLRKDFTADHWNYL